MKNNFNLQNQEGFLGISWPKSFWGKVATVIGIAVLGAFLLFFILGGDPFPTPPGPEDPENCRLACSQDHDNFEDIERCRIGCALN